MKLLPVLAVAGTALVAGIVWWSTRADGAPPAVVVAGDPVAASPVAGAVAAPIPPAVAARTVAPAAPNRTSAATGHVVRGTLRQHGKPLANVALRVLTGQAPDVVEVDATTTEADGSFAFAMPKTMFCFVTGAATAPRDWWSDRLPSRDSDWQLGVVNVPRGGAIRGRVVDADGAPVIGAEIESVRRDPSSPLPSSQSPLPRSGADGAFALDNLHPGGHELRAVVAARSCAEDRVDVLEAGEVVVELRLPRGRLLTGVVVDWRGQPLPGARVRPERQRDAVITDARGWFAIEQFVGDGVFVEAPGHIEDSHDVSRALPEQRIELDRAITLRGRVLGAGSAPTRLWITAAKYPAADAARPAPWAMLDRPLPVASDGSFVVEGLSTADFVVRAEAEGLGASSPQRIALRDDATIELRIAALPTVSVRVQDMDGKAIDGAEVVVDPGVAEYPMLYLGPEARRVSDRIFQGNDKRSVLLPAGRVVLTIRPNEPLALGARHRGYLSATRVCAAGEVPAEIVFVLQRAGSVRGVVRGGVAGEHGRSVVLWPLADDAKMLAPPQPAWDREWFPHAAEVDAEGRFLAAGLEPGAWRACVARQGTARLGERPDQQVGAVPLLDEGADRRAVVDFEVVAAEETSIELTDEPLGTLSGRVMLRGAPCAEVQVFAVRPNWSPPQVFSGMGLLEDNSPDWDDDLIRGWVAGQQTGADGSFTFRYREAGPIELRLRHARGAATSPPTSLVLPAPEVGMQCLLVFEAGAIRGRFRQGSPAGRSTVLQAVLYPMHKASEDPGVAMSDHDMPLSWRCAKVELAGDGRFSFDYLPKGDWLVRIENGGFSEARGPLWQRIVNVQGEVAELGDLQPTACVAATLRWSWPVGDTAVRTVRGVWVHSPHGGDARAVWVGTFAAEAGVAPLHVPPGRYSIEPFGHEGEPYPMGLGGWGLSGSRLAPPIVVEVHADGRTTPAELAWTPLPPAPPSEPR